MKEKLFGEIYFIFEYVKLNDIYMNVQYAHAHPMLHTHTHTHTDGQTHDDGIYRAKALRGKNKDMVSCAIIECNALHNFCAILQAFHPVGNPAIIAQKLQRIACNKLHRKPRHKSALRARYLLYTLFISMIGHFNRCS